METYFKYSLSDKEENLIIDFLSSLDAYSVLQNPLWNKIINAHKKTCYYLKYDGEKLVSYALIIENFLEIYVPFGPLSKKSEIIVEAVTEIRKHYQKRGKAILIIQLGMEKGQDSDAIEKNIYNIAPFKQIDNVLNWSTITVDLSQPIELINSKFSQNHKRSLKKAVNAGLSVKTISTQEDISILAAVYNEMYSKRKILKPFENTFAVFSEILNMYFARNRGFFLGVYNSEAVLIGGACFTIQKDTIMYQYGCSSAHNNLPILHIAFYEAIKMAQEMNMRFFDFCGYNEYVQENDQVYHINRFKKGFAGQVISYPKRLYFTLNKPKMFIFKILKYVYRLIKKL